MSFDEEMLLDLMPTTPVMTLAQAFAACTDADAEESEEIQSLLLCAGQELYQTVGIGRWTEMDIDGFLARMFFRDEDEEMFAALRLMGFYGWMQVVGLIDPTGMKRQVRAIAEVAPPHPALENLCARLESAADRAQSAMV